MRISLIMLAVVCAACATGPGSPPDSIAGTWSSDQGSLTPAGPLELVLAESSTVVSGTAHWAGQTYSVTGYYDRPTVSLSLQEPITNGRLNPPIGMYGAADGANMMKLSGTTFQRH